MLHMDTHMLTLVPPKRDSQPVTFRLPPDLVEMLDKFVEEEPDWNKTEAVLVGLYGFLSSPRDQRNAGLLAYRGRHGKQAQPNPPKKPGK